MNKNRYRIIFSKAKNMFIAVAENIKSQSKATGQSTHSMPITESIDSKSFHQLWQVKSIVASMSLFIAFSPVYAQMQADPNAAASQRAIIGVGQNQQGQNVPVVNIQTPKNGVSHNVYNQFDVLQPGVILNNSRNGAGSVIVGQVGANPYLQTGEARVILNEVNSAAASRFEGNLEVAGQRADVIIANPSGINIQGGGFINANKAIFTTGKPQLNEDGSIKQFVVDQGKINVGSNGNNLGLGGNNNNADYVDIYAKAVELNAQVHANQALQVVTGSNTISDDLSSITPNQDNSTTPTFALDVKALGGMYANNIFIIGTDKGLGVSNAGTIQSPQTLVVTSTGKIENTGAIQNTNSQDSLLSINTGDGADIVSSGSMITNGNLFLESGQNITLDKARLEKHGADNQNIISVSAKGDVSLQNSTNVQNFGEGGNLYIDASNINLGNDINIGVNGSIFLDAKQNLNATAVRNISSIYDINLSGGDLLTLNNTPVWANSGNINLGTTKQNSNLAVNSTSLNAEKDLNIYGAGTVSINHIGLDKVGETTKTKNFNVNAQGDLTWQNAGISLPTITGKLDLRSNGKLDISGSQFITQGGINLSANELVVNSQLRSNKEINLTATEHDLNLNVGIILSSVEDVNVAALQGNLNTSSLKALSETGSVSLFAYGNTNLQANPNLPVTADSTRIDAQKAITIASVGTEALNLDAATLNSSEGGIKVQSEATANIKDSQLNAKGNVELFAKENLLLNGVNANSQQHIALNSKKNIFINSQAGGNDVAVFNNDKSSQFISQGIVSATSEKNINAQNLKLIGGAVLIEAGETFNTPKSVELNATGSALLRNNQKLNSTDGDLSIQSNNTLTLDPRIHKLSATGDIDLISKNSALSLIGYGGSNGNGSEEVIKLNALNGGISLQGQSVELQGSQLEAKKDIKILSTNDRLTLIGVKNTLSNIQSLNQVQKQTNFLNQKQNQLDKFLQSEDYKNYITNQTYLEIINLKKEGNRLLEALSRGEGSPNDQPRAHSILKLAQDKENKLNLQFKNILQVKNSLENNLSEIRDLNNFFNSNVNGYEHSESILESNTGDILILSKKGISISGVNISAKNGHIDIESQSGLDQQYKSVATKGINSQPTQFDASIIIDGTEDFYDKGGENDANYSMRTLINPTIINGKNGVNIRTVGKTAADNLVLQATGIISQNGDVKIESFKNILFDAAVEQSYDRSLTVQKKKSWGGLKKKYITTRTENEDINAASVEIQAKNISIESKEANNQHGNIDIYSGKFDAEGNISIRSSGNINFFTAEESSRSNEDVTKKSSFAGIKYNSSKTNSTRSQVSQIPATLKADYIGVKSGFDTRLVGTEFEYLKGAEIESGGTIFIQPAITNITETLKKEKNSVVWQSMQDKGSITETAQLPSFNGPTPPVFNAAGGLEVQIPIGEKDQNKVQIKDEILKLANQPGNQYLKDLVNRNDVDWNSIILAQKDWDYKSQGLTGAGAAIIVIIVTILTYGAGTAAVGATTTAAAGGGTVTTFGGMTLATTTVSGVTTYTAAGTMVNAALTSLATQSSVSLVNNGGNISQTLKELGSKEYVKSLATSVITAGVLEKVSTTLNLPIDSTKFNDRLYVGLVNNTSSALINTAINGGSLSDNLDAALLAGFANVLQAELSQNIGLELDVKDPSNFEYLLHKIAHIAAGCAAGALQKQCEAGAIGAGVGEVVAGMIEQPSKDASLTEIKKYQEKVINTSKLISGTIAGVVGYDVGYAASSASLAVSNNYLTAKNYRDLKANYDSCISSGGSAGKCSGDMWAIASNISKVNDDRLRTDCAIADSTACINGMKDLFEGERTRNELNRLNKIFYNSEYSRFNTWAKFNGFTQADKNIRNLGSLYASFEKIEYWQKTNCSNIGLSTADCQKKYTAYLEADRATHAQIAAGLDKVKSMAIIGNGVTVGSAVITLITGTSLSSDDPSRLIALAEIASVGFSRYIPQVGSMVHVTQPKSAGSRYTAKLLDNNKDQALDPNSIRNAIALHPTWLSGNKDKINSNTISIAVAKVQTSKGTENILAVSGKSWSGNAPTTVNINGNTYKVIVSDTQSVKSIQMGVNDQGRPISNYNHAEMKLFSYIKDSYSATPTKVTMAIQNTANTEKNPAGLCTGCVFTSSTGFTKDLPFVNLTIFHGSTKK